MSTDLNSIAALASKQEELARPIGLSMAPNPQALIKALRRRWRLASPIAIVAAILGAVGVWFALPSTQYSVRTLLRIPPGSPFLFRTSEPVPVLLDHQRNQVAMVKSRLVLMNVLKDKRVTNLKVIREQPDPVQWLERELYADFMVAPEVMRIMLVGDEPAELVTLVNVIREVYKSEVLDKERADRSERLSMLQQQHQKYEALLKERKDDQRKFEQAAGGRDSGARSLALAFDQQRLTNAERELLVYQSDLRRFRIDLAMRQAGEKGLDAIAVPETLIEEQLDKLPAIQSGRAEIQQYQSDLEKTIKVAKDGDKSPKAIEIRRKIEEAEQTLVLMKKRLIPGLTEEFRQRTKQDAAKDVRKLQVEIALAEENEKILDTYIATLRTTIKNKSENVGKAEAARDDMAYLEDLTKRIGTEMGALEFELQAPDRYRLLEDAVATKPADNKRGMLTAGGAGVAIFAGVMLAFALLEFRTRRVNVPDDVIFGLGLPLVGALPDTHSHENRVKPGEFQPSSLDEAVDTVRTMLLKAAQEEPLRVVLITSAQSGEGKTSLSTHLAASLSQVGYTTLLIDGDLRNPIAHKVFNLERGPGLCDLLRAEVALNDVIRPTNVNRMFMITAGRWDGSATRALAQDGTRQLINELRTRFDFIIIDSSPVLPVVDPLLLGQNADGAILSVLRDVSRMPNIFAAYQRLSAGGVRVMGAVMSGVSADHYGAYYPYRAADVEPEHAPT